MKKHPLASASLTPAIPQATGEKIFVDPQVGLYKELKLTSRGADVIKVQRF